MYNPALNTVLDRMLTLSRAMDDAVVDRIFPAISDVPTRSQLWLPPVDTYQTEKAFVIEADVPGVHPENVEINFANGALTISGMRGPTLPAQDKEREQLQVFTAERVAGQFSRSIRLPDSVDAEKIEATFAFGVLTVTVPKLPSAMARKITVQVKDAKGAPKVVKG
ncbi:MAG: Hsp20/alpha crystallin family protein [Gemmatimonadetes bacterium]|nr:Hsp20/alpha crystallin family protein [Gemmatimonadota bacterium]MBI3569409.1 Hsp20/alpha crystallin family protein [Gemmatimonadota bacterium]